MKAFVNSIVKNLTAPENRLEELRSQQQQDEVTKQLMCYGNEGWPEKSHLPGPLKPYWSKKDELNVQQELLLKGNRCDPLDVLDRTREAHQGIAKCREHAKDSVWSPGEKGGETAAI